MSNFAKPPSSSSGFSGERAEKSPRPQNFTEIAISSSRRAIKCACKKPNIISTNLNGGLGKSFGNLFRQDFNTFEVGITINFPLENNRAKAELRKNLVESEKLELEKRLTSQNITTEVRNAVQSLQTLKLRLQSVKNSREATEKEFESEERKYNKGYASGSLFIFLEKQKNLTSAKAAEVQVRLEINKVIAEFERVTGNLTGNIQILFK